ncbi:unnamed protein product [Lactuca saligna]|uniref:Uncharacterized protein n=1 Tax=Lactuca saligna TaxID=75948 RepID=A0AA35ZEU5_LACSI|nr:unnamed protein product [Lactuca saligna]
MHLLVLAKVKLLGLSKLHRFTTTPLLATLIWPFFLKVMLSLRPIQDIVRTMVHDSRLFIFQLNRIITLQDDNEGERRWGRFRRLVYDRLVDVGRIKMESCHLREAIELIELKYLKLRFKESYYLSNEISPLHDGQYIVQFQTLLNNGDLNMFRKIVKEEQIGSTHPEILVNEFYKGDIVDANHMDG